MSLEIEVLSASDADEVRLTAALTALINDVYAVAEAGLWVTGAARTTIEQVTGLMRAGEIVVARLDGQIAGCVRLQILGAGVGEFGMLAVAPSLRGTGVGRDLVRFAEDAARERRCHTMQLQVLVPRGWSHPSKEFLTDWYTRTGYLQVRIGQIEETYPEQAPLLATPCDYVIYQRRL